MDFIIHQIRKNKDDDFAHLELKSQLSSLEQGVEEDVFMGSLQNLFKSEGMLYGKFSDVSAFLTEYKNNSNQMVDDLDLITFSRASVERLKGIMLSTRFSTGGFICYLTYESDGDAFLMVLIMNLTESLSLEESDDKFSVVSTEHLDMKHLRMGLQFNISAFERGDNTHVFFQSGSSREPSDYFYNDYAGAENIILKRKATKKLVDWLDKHIGQAAEYKRCEHHEFKAELDSFLEGRDSVSLSELKQLFFPGDEDKQSEFIDSANQSQVPNHVVLDRAVLNRFKTHKVKPKGSSVDLKFTALDVENKKIIPDFVNKSLIIPGIDETLLEKLK